MKKIYLLIAAVLFIVGLYALVEPEIYSFGIGLVKPADLDEPKSIGLVLLGQPGVGYSGGELTDSIIAAKIFFDQDKSTRVFLISLPRDLYVKEKSSGKYLKINELLTNGKNTDGGTKIVEKINEILGPGFNYYIVFNLNILKKAVAVLGQIEVSPAETTSGLNSKNIPDAGKRILDENQIEDYVKSRNFKDGDFTRMKNQQKVLLAILEKIKSLRPIKDFKKIYLLYRLSKEAETNIGFKEAGRLSTIMGNFDAKLVKTSTIDIASLKLLIASSTKINNQESFILIPRAGIEEYSEIKKSMASWIKE